MGRHPDSSEAEGARALLVPLGLTLLAFVAPAVAYVVGEDRASAACAPDAECDLVGLAGSVAALATVGALLAAAGLAWAIRRLLRGRR